MYSTKRVEKYLELAKEASKNSDFPQHKLGSVAVYKGLPLAIGWNTLKTSPIQKEYNKKREGFDTEADYARNNTLHSEMMTLNKIVGLDIDYSKVSVFVFRSTKDGKRALSRPCAACRRRMLDLGIKDCYFTVDAVSEDDTGTFGYERMEM